MLKVLHIFGQMDRGGAETRTVELMPLLKEKGIQFDFCVLREGDGPLDERVRSHGGQVHVCALRPGALTFPKRFRSFLSKHDYTIVHSHLHYFSGFIVKYAAQVGLKKRIVHFRNTGDGCKRTLFRMVYDYYRKRLIDRYATDILAVCKGAMDHSLSDNWENDARTQVVYNGLDLTPYQSSERNKDWIIKEFNLPDNSFIVAHVGRFMPQKSHDVLVRAAKSVVNQNPNVYFILIGIGLLQDDIREMVQSYNISDNVHFAGLRSDVPKILKSSDLFVLPSNFEGLPGVVLEAVAAGLPIIATELPGVIEIQKYSDLIKTIPVGDDQKLAEEILNNVNNITPIKNDAHLSFPNTFNLNECANQFYNVYSKES